jgi:hypothetical protein
MTQATSSAPRPVRLAAWLLFLGIPAVAHAQTRLAELTVHAGEYERVNAPVSAVINGLPLQSHPGAVRLYEVTGGKSVQVAFQLRPGDPDQIAWILSGPTSPGATRNFELRHQEGGAAAAASGGEDVGVRLADSGECGSALTGRCSSPLRLMPLPAGVDTVFRLSGFIHPLWSPQGEVLSRIQPRDHWHHYGLWNPWTATEFEGRKVDFWNIGSRQGRVVSAGVVARSSGPVVGGFKAIHEHIDHTAPGGDRIAIEEQVDVTVWNVTPDRSAWVIDFMSTLSPATDQGITIKAYRGLQLQATEKWATRPRVCSPEDSTEQRQLDARALIDVNGVRPPARARRAAVHDDPPNYNYPDTCGSGCRSSRWIRTSTSTSTPRRTATGCWSRGSRTSSSTACSCMTGGSMPRRPSGCGRAMPIRRGWRCALKASDEGQGPSAKPLQTSSFRGAVMNDEKQVDGKSISRRDCLKASAAAAAGVLLAPQATSATPIGAPLYVARARTVLAQQHHQHRDRVWPHRARHLPRSEGAEDASWPRRTCRKRVDDLPNWAKQFTPAQRPNAEVNIARYQDYREMLAEHPEIDAVVVSTPDHAHLLPVLEPALLGKAIYMQKPHSLTVAEGRVMSDFLHRMGTIFSVGSQQRGTSPWPQFKAACEAVRNGRIGNLRTVQVGLPGDPPGGIATPQPVPPNLDYDRWLGTTPHVPYTEDRVHSQNHEFAPGWLR